MTKKKARIGWAFLAPLFCAATGVVFALPNVNASAEEETTTADIVISDDFGQSGSVSSFTNIFESSHVTKDSAGNPEYGIVPGTAWGALVDADDGYITYKLEATEGNLLSTVDVSALVTAGHQAGLYWYNSARQNGENVLGANFTIGISTNNENFAEVYNLQSETNAYSIAEEAQYTATTALDMSVYGYPKTAYVRMNLLHFTQEEVNFTAASMLEDGKVALGKLGVLLHSTQIEINEISEAEIPNGITVEDDFTSTGLDSSNVFEYNNVVTDTNGNVDYALVPGTTWGAATEAGNGYVTYKISPSEGKYITSLKIDMTAFLSHCSLPEYISSDTTDVRVDISNDNTNWRQVYSLYADTTVKDWYIKNHQEENTKYNISLDLTENVGTLGDFYVRVRLLNLTYNGLTDDHKLAPNVVLEGTEKIILGCLGARLYKISLKTWEGDAANAPEPELPPPPLEPAVYYDDAKIDYGRYLNTQDYWKSTVFETEGLAIRKDVSYRIDGKDEKFNALAPASTNSEGYVTYKFVASDSKTFASALLKSRARLFDYNLKLEWEKVDYYISYDNETFELVHKSLITLTGSNSPEQSIDLSPYVYGRNLFFVKVVIGCSSDTSWTNMRTFEMDVEFFAPSYSVSYELNGGQNAESNYGIYETGKGMKLAAPTKEGYIFGGWYTEKEFVNRIYEISSAQEGEMTLFAKWIKDEPVQYAITYVLDGGQNAESNADKYFMLTGMKLADPTKAGYIFGGWYTEAEFINRVYEISASQEGEVTLYAKWIENGNVEIPVPDEDLPKQEAGGCQSSVVGIGLIGSGALFAAAIGVLCKRSKEND